MAKLVFFGCGGVGCALLEMIFLKRVKPLLTFQHILVVDPRDLASEPIVVKLVRKGILTHKQVEITRDNLISFLNGNVKKNDTIIDVSYNIYFKPLIQWCMDHNVHYINTSMERWPVKDENVLEKNLYPRTLYRLHEIVRKIKGKYNPTVVVEHGMNPGLVTHFTKKGIQSVAKEVLSTARKEKIQNKKISKLHKALKEENFPLVSYLLKLETVHCSERDTQIANIERKTNEFMNTWGAYSFYGEGVDPVQLGYGTHEKRLRHSSKPPKELTQNQIFLPVRGIDLQFQSYVPNGLIHGMVVPHGENDTIGRCLTLYENNKVKYRPSNYYVYSPCPEAWKSIKAVANNNYEMLPLQHPLRGTEIKSGEDAVGALLIFKYNPIEYILYGKKGSTTSYWSGTILSIEQTRKKGIKYAGPTVVQVAISLISVLEWMRKNGSKGLTFPEDIPYEKILKRCKPWLGNVFMDWVPYHPKTTRLESFLTS